MCELTHLNAISLEGDDFRAIAQSKRDISVRTGKNTRDVPAKDRLDGETEYWGSVVFDLIIHGLSEKVRIVIAGSGYKSPMDEAICYDIAYKMQALIETFIANARDAGDDSIPVITFPEAA